MRPFIALVLVLSQFALSQSREIWDIVYPFMYSSSYTLGICQGMGAGF
jgi:hypothetical protein